MLNEEQQSLEKRVEQLRLACQNVSKRVQTCLSTQGKPADNDKKLVLLSYTTTTTTATATTTTTATNATASAAAVATNY